MDNKEFFLRRKRLMKKIGVGNIAILPTSLEQQRNSDVNYPFRPNSNFAYLTGFTEPEALMVLIPGRKQGQFVLFCRERDQEKEIWNGKRAGLEGAQKQWGADEARPIQEVDQYLPELIKDRQQIYCTLGESQAFDQQLMSWVKQVRAMARKGVSVPTDFIGIEPLLHEMRLFKSSAEIKAMRKAAIISANAHRRAMQFCQPGMMEYEVEAEISHEFNRMGCRDSAYSSIVAGGENACILHYTENNMPLNDGELLLIDAGAEYDLYAADITRTFPINGRFNTEQRALYEVVLKAQQAAIKKVKPGNHWNAPHTAAVLELTKGLIKLGLLKGTPRELIKKEAYKLFYMHSTGHWLGMDVHDVGDYKRDKKWRTFEPGMVLTIEPGLYIASGSKGIAKKWWNIGIRIEDNILVTSDGNEVLTHGAPKTIADIEDQCNKQ
ncbi:MAG: Xaa-Pro aminopeptidase [Gammaproteobacteria bacterium]|nr:Xaa-Pro aminopeptidase [Gammaproteobacteria bacterium]